MGLLARAYSLRLPTSSSIGLGLVLAAVGGCSSSSGGAASATSNPLCKGTGRCIAFTASSTEADIAGAFAQVKDGDTLAFPAGTFAFRNQLALGKANGVTIIGSGKGQTILDFKGQVAGEDGIFAQSVSNLTLQDFTIQDTPGNATKELGIVGLTFRGLEVKWNAADAKTHGAYGVYPVQSQNVLIENCKISGANDSGIYVGQSQHIVVRSNEAFQNVAGIEIENSFFADVTMNDAHDNTGGILIFDLPGLMQTGGHDIRVFQNHIHSNNTPNFAPVGDIVSVVPAGTGTFVMANHNVEVFSNTIEDNNTSAAGIISYEIAQMKFTDPNYYEWPSQVYFHDNTYTNNGTHIDVSAPVGQLLLTGATKYPNGHVPDVLQDGIVDPAKPAGPNPMQICIHEPGASAVCNLHLDKLDTNAPDESAIIDCDASPYDCTLPAIAPVSFAGL